MKDRLSYLALILLLLCSVSWAEIRYVSKTGSSTPPYTSWETAADSIQKAVDVSQWGDTIYVANGRYKGTVVMVPGLSLIGAGMDSCVIDMTTVTGWTTAVTMKDSCLIKGFKIDFVPNNYQPTGIYMNSIGPDYTEGCTVIHNRIDNAYRGIWATEGIIRHNIIINSLFGITLDIDDLPREYIAYIDSNYISNTQKEFRVSNKTKIKARNNIIMDGGSTLYEIFENTLGGSMNPEFSNNIIIPKQDLLWDVAIRNSFPGEFNNNLFLARYKHVFRTYPVSIKNNIIVGSENVLYSMGSTVQYNNLWNVTNNPFDSTNISADPMFVNDTSDFRLQMFSPLIDAGDPDILDKDSSRSDIGPFGGPYGEIYSYQDLPPRTPVNFSASGLSDTAHISLKWKKNTETDFNLYRIYRDTVPNFILSENNLLKSTRDTFYTELLPQADRLYYKATSVDNQENASLPTEEIAVIISSLNQPEVIVQDYMLFQNYPNPFNPSTTISYRMSRRGYVKLYIYDLTGSVVDVLVNEEKSAGYHEREFIPKNLASGIYIYQINITDSERQIPVFTAMDKMIYLK
jgi:hypothetical protein